MTRNTVLITIGISVSALCTHVGAQSGSQILEGAGVKGGLIAHVGCGDGTLTLSLRANDQFLVHGLDSAPENVEKARARISSAGLSGPVSIELWKSEHLPYIDNILNLLVIEPSTQVAAGEIERVLCPGGVALFIDPKSKTPIRNWVKPRPVAMDEWTHYLHDAGGNAVSHDTLVGPPKHLQWVGSPDWTRHHEHMSSFNAMVSSGGRVFYLLDEGLRAEIQLPPKWSLLARDAFNGSLLWRRSIDEWHSHLWPAKSGPAQLPRRIVAEGNTLYVTLGIRAPVSALDAATGKTIRTYDQTPAAEEILCSNGTLFALLNPKPGLHPWATKAAYETANDLRSEVDAWSWDGSGRSLVAVETATGKTLWTCVTPVVPLSLAIDNDSVFFHDGSRIVSLDRQTGQRRWESAPIARASEIRSWFSSTLVVSQDVVVFAGAEKMERHSGAKADTMTALSAKSGEVLWTAPHPACGYCSPEDVLVIDGLIWTAPLTNRRDSGEFTGRDLHTGEIKRTFASDNGDVMPHHRCHRAKATDKYILASRTGIEYVDLAAEHWNRNDWVRGACLYGIMPANGLTYAPPQSCACYVLAKLAGLNALASERVASAGRQVPSAEERLERGPSHSELRNPKSEIEKPGDWPTFRHDLARSGFTAAAMPAELRQTWKTKLGEKLSSPVVAGGKVFVAAVDRHAIHALDESTGAPVWQFLAGGRIDSPPTIWQGLVLFGSHDGYVYCHRASDGTLCWRFRAAPADQRLVAYEQVESVWPVHGSVLVREGAVHCVAGRSMFLDGGMRYLRLDAQTGKLLSETILNDQNPVTGKALDAGVVWPNLPVALPDILSSDAKHVYMRSQVFDLLGQRTEVAAPSDYKDQTGETAHLFCNTGFLDDSWWHRSLWIYGKTTTGGAGGWHTAAYRTPAGRIMTFDSERVYAFDRRPQYYPQTNSLEYHLYAARKEPNVVEGKPSPNAKRNHVVPSRIEPEWSSQVPLLGRALVLAGQTLFVSGPPDVVDEEETLNQFANPETWKRLADQAAAYEGKKGALLLGVSAGTGAKVVAYQMPEVPVFDGMVAANEALFVSTLGGEVLRLGAKGKPLDPAPEVRPKPLDPPAQTARSFAPTDSVPGFQHLSQVRVTPAGLGWRVQAAPGQVGFALQELATPLTKQATFTFRLHLVPKDKSPDPARNGFLVFGDAPEEQFLIKCGMRRKQGLIIEGPYAKGKITAQTLDAQVDETCDVQVSVDLEAQKVTMTAHGKTVETNLERRLEAIRFIGYAANSVTAEFSKIEQSQ